MFSKFKIEKPSHVLYKHGARHFKAEKSANILSLPLVEAYDQQIRLMRAEIERLRAKESIDQAIMQSQVTELTLARAEAFQLRQEIQLLRDEVARSHLQVYPVKDRVKFNVTRKSFWDLEKSARSLKRKKIGEYFRKAAEKELPAEFKPTEVCLGNFWLYFLIILRLVQDHVQLLKLFVNYLHWNAASYYTQIKLDVSGKELVIPLSSNPQAEQDDDDGEYTGEIVQRILAAKDEGLVSDKAYHEIRMALPEHVRAQVPPLSSLLQERKKQNEEISITTIPELKP